MLYPFLIARLKKTLTQILRGIGPPKNLTAETQSPQSRQGENGDLCELRVSAVKKVEENPCHPVKGFS
jgi:hypothetical protein